jgi:hypothetical protein
MTPRDLSVAGWRVYPGAPDDGVAVIDGALTRVTEIDAVLTRLAGVTTGDVPWIVRADRVYVAQEMTAFLLAWLSELACPVVNRPTPTGLWGPYLPRDAWGRRAVRAGMRVAPGNADRGDEHAAVTVTVVGERCLGHAAETLHAGARSLARGAAVDVLAARFAGGQSGSAFLDAGYRAPVDDPEVADALLELMAPAPA